MIERFLRKNVTKMGYYIEDEVLVEDKNIIYTVIKFSKGKKKYNYKELIKNIFNIDNNIVIYRIIKESYTYTSIIVLYYILINKYNYSYKSTSIIITNIYFYGIIFIRYINYLLKNFLHSIKYFLSFSKKLKNNLYFYTVYITTLHYYIN